MKLTIYFDGSFWCGLIEFSTAESYQAIRHVFGPEPKDADVFAFVYHVLPQLLAAATTCQPAEEQPQKRINPKRMQRMINREKNQPVVSTKAQQAISEMRKTVKLQRKSRNKQHKLQREKERFEMRQEKRRQKHRGH
ncbi:hypothetical protein NRIC_28000 [Enterococcus florum]|uniref:DUF2992 domain-containing protein n=1 Tax=Enterococcus florum TaxID=2480627 RepID=A0A4V0WPS8_9ENTE|nr:YjdF family protein [Enterococcus florum]GCF94909.1 hypothetical protein NRIC_28000 [Enterococcus florum]